MKLTLVALLPFLAGALAAPMNDGKKHEESKPTPGKGKFVHSFPFDFTSMAMGWAGPDQVINNSQVAVPGLPAGYGEFQFGLNSEQNVLCYNISVYVKGNYSSPAVTATHIHEAVRGRAGPPRIAFPNPVSTTGAPLSEFSWRRSVGCLTGPFTTGVLANGSDTGTNFTVAKLESNIEGFFADTHTVEFPAGAIRGQLYAKK
ncbi:uncharacterized protein MKK02DRAFT_33274 [Dioszegia hungarica]|uniref:CHRD domain-containing protein n=1 Tax=Dioszegia hungarica TaxID=4972 RepID=A0AA38H7S5_9TREE|nr:uncharacterized protein MKK02DRAFT_33274 [Dioszegia hungarica]KAI9635972.1 hypothetical protein MKK02DRAFT_33274 [Dioszegia hungarica]